MRKTLAIPVVAMALLALILPGAGSSRDATALSASVDIQGLPPLTAPGAAIPLNWTISSGSEVTVTRVLWDVTSHAYDNNYLYRTRDQRGTAGTYVDYIDVPLSDDIEAIYLKPYALVDGLIVFSSREYTVPTRRAINGGSGLSLPDTSGLFWYGDRDFQHHWYGFEDGERRSVSRPMAGTADDWIYQSQRLNLTSFRCWLNTGALRMQVQAEFHLAELEATTSGERVFDILMEDTPVLESVDVYDLVGIDHALVLTRAVTVEDYELNITFKPVQGRPPMLNGLVLRGISAVPQRQMHQRIAFPADDSYVDNSGNHPDAPQLLLGGSSQYHAGLRFCCLPIPQGATIHRAVLQVTAVEDAYWNTNLAIYGHASDDSPDFRPGELWLNKRPHTSAYVLWQMPYTTWRGGRPYSSPDLRAIIQEIVNRQGWQPHHSLSLLLVAGQGDFGMARKVWAYEGSMDDRAWLFVDYTPLENLPPTPAATLTSTPMPTSTSTPEPTATRTAPAQTIRLPLLQKQFARESLP